MFSEERDILDLVQEVYLEMYRNIDLVVFDRDSPY